MAVVGGKNGSSSAIRTKIELRIECEKLADRDLTSKSDPCVQLKIQRNGRWVEHGRTERLMNTLNPKFSTPFVLDYFFEEVQKLKFLVYDLDNDTYSLGDDDFLGQMECTVGQIVSKKSLTKPLQRRSSSRGQITIVAEELSDSKQMLVLSLKGHNLDKKDFMGKSDPFLELWRLKGDGTSTMVHRTEYIKNNLNPQWNQLEIRMQTICGGNMDASIIFRCSDYDDDGSHDLIGEFTATVKELQSTKEFSLINVKKQKKKKGYKNSGVVVVNSCSVVTEHSFLDYVFGGCQVSFVVAVDFTGSNGDPRDQRSLHFMGGQHLNEYQQAISAVGQVIQDYDTDKLFPAYGFGAKVPPRHEVSHNFPLSFNPNNPNCQGIYGILAAYQSCVPQIQLWGPTNFSPIIRQVAQSANETHRQSVPSAYQVLMILTDGAITDMDDTLDSIVSASVLPMSIIIIGVGGADFSNMELLDGDDGVLKSPAGRKAERDIVQFVPFRDYKKASAEVLASCVLAEVPDQLVKYFKKRGVAPRPAQQGHRETGTGPEQPHYSNQPQQPGYSNNQPPTHPGGAPPYPGGAQPQYSGGSQPPYPGGAPQYAGGPQPPYPGGAPQYPGGAQPQYPSYPGGPQPPYPGGAQPPYPGGAQPPYPGGAQPPYPAGPQADGNYPYYGGGQ